MGYSLRTTLHISRVRSPTQKKKKKKKKQTNKQAKICEGVQTSEKGAEGEEGERASAGVFGSPEQPAEKDSFASLSLGYRS